MGHATASLLYTAKGLWTWHSLYLLILGWTATHPLPSNDESNHQLYYSRKSLCTAARAYFESHLCSHSDSVQQCAHRHLLPEEYTAKPVISVAILQKNTKFTTKIGLVSSRLMTITPSTLIFMPTPSSQSGPTSSGSRIQTIRMLDSASTYQGQALKDELENVLVKCTRSIEFSGKLCTGRASDIAD